jgi:hypothetical protein
MSLVTLHHSLYYAPRAAWDAIVQGLYREILARPRRRAPGPAAAIHAVLMSARTRDPASTTRLYEDFAGRFCGALNEQDLLGFARGLRRDPAYADARVVTGTTRVTFFVDDFERFISVIWMILLYPNVHRFTEAQLREIIEHVYERHWRPRRPLIQVQDHVVVYHGRGDVSKI